MREIDNPFSPGAGSPPPELAGRSELLESARILIQRAGVREEKANLVLYRVNHACPVYNELHGLVVKTAGIADVILEELSKLDGVSYAFIFGSSASGEMDELSDIDIFVIGDSDFAEVSGVLHSAENTLNRQISPVTYKAEDFTDRLLQKNAFIVNVLKKPIIMLIGEENELRAMGSEQPG